MCPWFDSWSGHHFDRFAKRRSFFALYVKDCGMVEKKEGKENEKCSTMPDVLIKGYKIGSTPKSVDFNERRRIGQGPSIDNFQSFYSRRLGVVLASSCGGSLL